MGIIDIFRGKDPEKQEAQGDKFFESGAYGQARLEYESAKGKRRRETPNDARIPELYNKILRCSEALAAEHRKRGEDLADEGYIEEAREYYTLALDLTQDPDLISALESCLKAVESRQADAAFEEATATENLEPEIPDSEIPEPEFVSDDEYAEALFITVPDEIRDTYVSYGENFKTGYVALHQERFDEAADYLSLALEENSGPDSYVRLELATAYLNLKRFEEALALLEEFAPRQLSPMKYSMLCELYWCMNRFDRALELLDSIADEKETAPFFCLLRGQTLSRAGEHSRAESLYLNFLREHGWDMGIGRALAEIYEAVGDRENAHKLYSRIISSCSGCGVTVDPAILRKYADLCMEAGIQDEKILEIYLGLAEKDPENAAGYYRKVSRIYAALGHEKESRRFQRIALRYEGGGPGS